MYMYNIMCFHCMGLGENKKTGKIIPMYPGAKVRVITCEARYCAKTRAFASFYAIISRAHAARAVA